MANSSLDNSMNIKRQSKPVPTECKVCGAPALYSYFGAIVCQSCKIFFKRYAARGQEALKCDLDGHCEIDINVRRVCPYCRLAKCFKIGMQIEMIRSDRSRPKKTSQKRKLTSDQIETTSTALVRLNESEQFPTLNLLRSDQSTLTVDQWNLISNLSHCYDEHTGFSRCERYIREQNNLPLKLRFKCSSMIELFQLLIGDCQLLYQHNGDFLSLPANDRSILLQNTSSYAGTLSSNFVLYKVGLTDYPIYYDAIEIIIRSREGADAARCLRILLDFDITIMKLFLAILSFSTISYTNYSNTSPVNFSNMKQILRIQDEYIELAWRYLLHKYNYEWAVKCFSNFIRAIFAVNVAIVIAQEFQIQWATETFDSFVQQIEQTLTLND